MPDRPLTIAAIAAAFYAAFTLVALALHGWNPLWFVWISEGYAAGVRGGRTGYDGQFIFYIARDGWAAVPHLDNATYRLGRILFPALVRLVGGGNPTATAWLIPAINYVAIVATTALLAWWLRAGGDDPAASPSDTPRQAWCALVYAGFVGTFMSYSRDLTEPLAYGLGAAGVICWLRERTAAAVVLLALAGLARETSLLLAAALACAELAAGRLRRALLLAAGVVPLLIWQSILLHRFGASPLGPAATLNWIPLAGSLAHLELDAGRLSALLFVGIPSLLLFGLGAGWLWRDRRDPIAWLLTVHGLLGMGLNDESYTHLMGVARVMLGLVLALVLASPRLAPRTRLIAAAWAIAPTAIWLIPVLRWAPWTAVR